MTGPSDVDTPVYEAGVVLAAALARGGTPRLAARRVIGHVIVDDAVRMVEEMIARGDRAGAEEGAACHWRGLVEDALAERLGVVLCPAPEDAIP